MHRIAEEYLIGKKIKYEPTLSAIESLLYAESLQEGAVYDMRSVQDCNVC